ncbi:anthrax toxin receptor-like isoform X1 [Saccopteryx bilineata]|uniref:anthrax toxin receptor-like isoform X1 n=2 Tax=Saccopteryx bilineata TaxID=59482 RepID=UPI003390124E
MKASCPITVRQREEQLGGHVQIRGRAGEEAHKECFLPSPKLRISFITYATHGKTVMKLTSDRNKIREGLTQLQSTVPGGDINLDEGFKRANEQIQQVYSRDHKAVSLIITLTAGLLHHETLQAARKEADKARIMRAKVYSVGLKDYDRSQLKIIVGNKELYPRDDYSSMNGLVNSKTTNWGFIIVPYNEISWRSMFADIIWRTPRCIIIKEPPRVQPEKKQETCHIQTCPTVIVPCCECQEDKIQRMDDKLDSLCDFVQNYKQVSPMYCQPRHMRKCFSLTLMDPQDAQRPCGPKICLGPSQEPSFPHNSRCSWCQHPTQICSPPPPRMLPLIPPTARALHRMTFSFLPAYPTSLKTTEY